jgi:hypothetical protein
MDDQRPTRKHGLRFSLRDLFWLTLVVAMAFGWWLDHTSRTLLSIAPDGSALVYPAGVDGEMWTYRDGMWHRVIAADYGLTVNKIPNSP